jgi:gliding motility-associated-like protein
MRESIAILACCFSVLGAKAQFQGLVINEFSQGNTGNREYIEIVVAGNRTCTDSTADIRGWIVDDQNGWYGNTNSSQGHYRFKDMVNWSAVPFGSLILLYNSADKNTSIPLADDPSDADGDLTYIVPINSSTYLEQYGAGPGNNSGPGYVYPSATSTAGYVPTNNQWQFLLALNNINGDVISLVSPSNRTSASFSIAYGYTINAGFQTPTVAIPNVGAGSNAFLMTGNYFTSADWTISPVTTNETPGLPNGGLNTTWIAGMRLSRPAITLLNAAMPVCTNVLSQQTTLMYSAAHNFPTQYSIEWNNTPANSFTPVSNATLPAGSISIIVPAGAQPGTYTGNLTVSNTNGTSCVPAAFTVTINPLPVVSGGSYPSQCLNNGSLALTGSPAGGIFSGPGVFGNSFTPPGSGTFTLGYDYTDPATGCSSSATTNIAVYPQPAVTVSPSSMALCQNSNVGLAASGGVTYNWAPATSISSTIGNTVIASPTTSTIYTVTGTDANGCSNTATASITVLPAPAIPQVSVMQPTCASFGSIQVNAPAGVGFSYSIDGINYSNNSGAFANLVPGNYPVSVKDANGCISATVAVLINPPPAIPTAFSVSVTQPTCTNTTGSISITSSSGTGFSYSIDGSDYSNTSGVFTSLAHGNYDITVQNSTGCISPVMQAVINAPPVVPTVTVNSPVICSGTEATIIASTSPGGGYTYTWTVPQGVNNPGNVASFTTDVAGIYTVMITNGSGCSGSATAAITVNPIPNMPTLNMINHCNGTSTITASNYAGDLLWNNGSTSPTLTISSAGMYSVTQSLNGCVSAAAFVVANPNSAPPAPVVQAVQPDCFGVTGSITIQSPTGNGLEYSIDGVSFQNATQFTNVASGTYFVRVRNSHGCISAVTPITINPVIGFIATRATACVPEGGSYHFNGQDLTATGSYSTTYVRPGLCDSVVHLSLTVARTETQSFSGCGTYVYNGVNYLTPVALRDTITSTVTNCDSLYRVVNILIHPTAVSNVAVCLPAGQTYTFNGQSLSSSGQYTSIFTSVAGCDSTVHLTLVIPEIQTRNVSGCEAVLYNNSTYVRDTILTEIIQSTLTSCDSIITLVSIVVRSKPVITISPDKTICRGDSVTVNASSGNDRIEWPGFGTRNSLTVAPSVTTTYTAVATSPFGCINTASVIVSVNDVGLTLSAFPNPVIAGKPVQLKTNAATPYQVLSWQPTFRNATAKYQSLIADSTVMVKVTARSNVGCIGTDSLVLLVDPLGGIFIPTGFTPNADGKNDLFTIAGSSFHSFELKVFNRWGQVVFSSAQRTTGWDGRTAGKEQPAGTYVYIVNIQTKDGKAFKRSGTINLIR